MEKLEARWVNWGCHVYNYIRYHSGRAFLFLLTSSITWDIEYQSIQNDTTFLLCGGKPTVTWGS